MSIKFAPCFPGRGVAVAALALALYLVGCSSEAGSHASGETDSVPAADAVSNDADAVDWTETVASEDSAPEGSAWPPDLQELVFYAQGNEPFWNLRVYADRIQLLRMGEDPVEFGSLEDISEPGTGTWVYLASGAAGEIQAVIEGRPCADTMADVTYDYAASVTIGEQTLDGCARSGGIR